MPRGSRKPRARRPRRRSGRQTRRMVSTRDLQLTDGLTFAKFYDNNGVDEQGIFTLFPLQALLPASSTKIGNDYNRPATLTSCCCFIRWTNGLSNPPMVVQMEYNWSDSDGSHTYLSGQVRLNNQKNMKLFTTPPLALRARIIDNPSNEKNIFIRMNFLGRKLTATDIPTMEFDLKLKQDRIPIIVHSGKSYSLDTMMSFLSINKDKKLTILPSVDAQSANVGPPNSAIDDHTDSSIESDEE